MKRSLLFLFAALFALTAPMTPARADVTVPVDFFYDALGPDGDWIYVQNYGYVWQPLVAQDPNWAPYSDGYWAFTDAGWTWISNEDFGWITYHYGRWIRMQQNWMWVPGYEWAPAWVSWRQTQGQIGWAPLPPEAAWVSNIGFGAWTDSYYDVGPAYYNFVPMTAFASSSSLRPFIIDRSRNYTFYDQSVNITHINYRQNVTNHIFVGGPDPERIDRLGSNHVRRLTLRHDDDGFRREWIDRDRDRDRGRDGDGPRGRGGFSRVEKDQFVIAAPSIRRDGPQRLPSRVREHMEQPVVDRGWRGGPDADRLREKQRDEMARARPANLPDKSRQPVTSMTPPPATGRVLKPEEREGQGRPRDPRQAGEEVRPAVPVPGKGRPGMPGTPDAVNPPNNRGNTPPPDAPQRDRRPGGLPGVKPSEDNDRPNRIPGAKPDENRGRPDGAPGAKPDENRGRPGGAPGAMPDENRGRPGGAPGARPDENRGRPGGAPGARPDENRGRPGGAPGARPGENTPRADGIPPSRPRNEQPTPAPTPPPARREPQTPTPPPAVNPNPPGQRPDFPGNREQRPGRPRAEQPPPSRPNVPPPAQPNTAPPSSRVRPAPMPQPPQQQTPPARQMPAPRVNAPPAAPPPQAAPPSQPPPQGQNRGPRGQGERRGKKD